MTRDSLHCNTVDDRNSDDVVSGLLLRHEIAFDEHRYRFVKMLDMRNVSEEAPVFSYGENNTDFFLEDLFCGRIVHQ